VADDIERLLAFGRMGLETGYYEQARDSFEQLLALDPSNREAINGFGRANEMLRRMEHVRSAPRVEPAPPVEPPPRAEPTQQYEPARQYEPVKPTPIAEPQPTVPEWREQEWQGTPGMTTQEQPRLHRGEEDSVESRVEENLEWLSLQLKHVPIKTWIIVLIKVGLAAMFLASIIAIVAFVFSFILDKIDLNILEMLRDL
jgi:hypothetical protein